MKYFDVDATSALLQRARYQRPCTPAWREIAIGTLVAIAILLHGCASCDAPPKRYVATTCHISGLGRTVPVRIPADTKVRRAEITMQNTLTGAIEKVPCRIRRPREDA